MPKAPRSNAIIATGRKHTDRSLGAERAKADGSIADQRDATREGADRAIERSRDIADEQGAQLRGKVDRAVESARAGKPTSRAEERKETDKLVVAERASADRMLEAERERTDSTTSRERAASESAHRRFFTAERELTDRDLSRERGYIDEATHLAAGELGAAEAAHDRTRDELGLRDDFLTLLGRHLRQPMVEITVAADRLRRSARLHLTDAEDRSHVEAISRNSQEVLRLVGDLLERVEVWQPAAPAKVGANRPPRAPTKAKPGANANTKAKAIAKTKAKTRAKTRAKAKSRPR